MEDQRPEGTVAQSKQPGGRASTTSGKGCHWLVLVLVQLDKRTFVKTISFTTILQEGFICLFKLLAFKLKSFQRMSHEKAIQLFLWLRKTERKPQEWDRYCNLWGWLRHCRISASDLSMHETLSKVAHVNHFVSYLYIGVFRHHVHIASLNDGCRQLLK